MLDRTTAPDATCAVELQRHARRALCRLLDDHEAVEHSRLKRGEPRFVAVSMFPAPLNEPDRGISEVWDRFLEEIRRRNEVCVEDGNEVAFGIALALAEPERERAGFESGGCCPTDDDDVDSRGAQAIHQVADYRDGLVVGVVEHLDLEVFPRVVECGRSFDHSSRGVELVADGELDRDPRPLGWARRQRGCPPPKIGERPCDEMRTHDQDECAKRQPVGLEQDQQRFHKVGSRVDEPGPYAGVPAAETPKPTTLLHIRSARSSGLTDRVDADHCAAVWLRVLQRLVRLSPGPLRFVWTRIPERVRRVAGPLVHPIAVGPRSPGHVLVVPREGAPRFFDVIVDATTSHSQKEEQALATLAEGGHRVLALEDGMPLMDLARRRSIVDAIYVVRPLGSEERRAAAVRLGFRCVAEADLGAVAGGGAVFPEVTIIVVTYRNRGLCEACLAAVARNTPWPGLEVLVVDNGSRDGTARMLEELRARDRRVQVISNDDNLGFARAANQGLRRAQGDIVVLLNDDTVVGPGWLSRLVMHLESDARLGLVCPVTNEIGGDAKVPITYTTFHEMEEFAVAWAHDHAGQRRATKTVALFCAAARRSTLASVGFLDERYEVGMFEDDDLSLALRRHGMDLAVAEDAFVHHVGQATFGRLSDSEYLAIWEANRRRFEAKWGERWRPPDAGA